MAPIDAEIANDNTKALFTLGSHGLLVIGLLIGIARYIYKAHRNSPPALHTRDSHDRFRGGLATFAVLTAISLTLATYHALAWRYASYTNWAKESSHSVPARLWDGWFANQIVREKEDTFLSRIGAGGWQLGRWMEDTDLIAETNAAAILHAPGMWWTYQNFVGLIIWSLFVGIEGRHRKFPQYIAMSFILLSQLTSLSSAQNLFFVLLLLTPITLVDGTATPDSEAITVPHATILSVPALLGFGVLGSLPELAQHHLFPVLSSVGYFVLPLLITTLAYPSSLYTGTKYKSVAAARKSYEPEFRALALASLAFHAYFSYRTIAAETAVPHTYFRHNFVWNSHEVVNSRSEQAWAVFVKIVGTLGENPLISGVAWDVLLSGVSLCIWTVSHGVDVVAMLRCSWLSWTLPVAKTVQEQVSHDSTTGHSTSNSTHPKAGASDTPAKRRGRPRKATVDADYQPDPSTKAAVDKIDVDEPGEVDVVKETEGLALGWGLFILGGLGSLTTAVLGSEASAR